MEVIRTKNLYKNDLDEFKSRIRVMIQNLFSHEIYSKVNNLKSLKLFMQIHVFVVWDFMTVLGTLRNKICYVDGMWQPPRDQTAARMINEIFVGEESDEVPGKGFMSHFELYLLAMEEVGADTTLVQRLMSELQRGAALEQLLAGLPPALSNFMRFDLSLDELSAHEVAAVFAYGRENIVPEMFTRILENSAYIDSEKCYYFDFYLKRHIELDGDHHSKMADNVLLSLCGNDTKKWEEALAAARKSLFLRRQLWSEALIALEKGEVEFM